MSRPHKAGLILAVLILGSLLQSCGKSDTDKEKESSQQSSQVVRTEKNASTEESPKPESGQQPSEKQAEIEQPPTTGKQVVPQQAASPTHVGKLVLVRGKVYVKRYKADKPLVAKVGIKVYLNDHIITSKDGYARMRMRDDSILRIAPTSELAVTTQLLGPEHSNTTIDLLKGKLRAIVVHKLIAGDSYEVKTDVAVAGVRGTDFEVIAGRGTVVRCYTGVVAITNVDTKVTGNVFLTPRTYTVVAQEKPPIKPKVLPSYIVPMQDPPPEPVRPVESSRASAKPPSMAASTPKPPEPPAATPLPAEPQATDEEHAETGKTIADTVQGTKEPPISRDQANSLMDQSFQISQQNLRDGDVQRLWEQDYAKPLHEMLYGDGLDGWTMHPAK